MKISVSVLALVGVLGAVPAMAQPRWGYEPGYAQGLPLRVIMNAVRAQGLRPIARPRLYNRYYLVPASDRFGQPYHVLVNASSGRVMRIQAMGGPVHGPFANAERFGRGPSYAMRGPEDFQGYYGPGRDDGRLPRTQRRANLPNDVPEDPSAVPGSPPAVLPAPPHTERRSARPATPPMPRPRPPELAAAPASAPVPQEAAPAQPPQGADTQPAQTQPDQIQPPQARPAQAQPAHTPKRAAGAPRVVLPGGPVPKAERSAVRSDRTAQNASQRASVGGTVGAAPEVAASAGATATETPPQAPAAAPVRSEIGAIPPAQSYE